MRQQENAPRKFLNSQEAADHLGISKSKLDKDRVLGGGCPYHKFGRKVLYSIEDLNAFAAQRRRVSTSEPARVAA